jgi:hypothetical protein
MVKAQRVRSPRLPGGSGIVAARGAAADLATAGGPQPAAAFSYRGGLLLRNAHLYLIYWGAAWAASASPSASQVTAAVRTILASHYMDGLAQYHGIGPATITGQRVVSSSDPPPAFADSDIAGLIFELIEAGTIPDPADDPRLIYFVFLPAGVRSVRDGVIGEHSYFAYLDLDAVPAGSGFPLGNAHYAWVGNDGTLDSVTTVFSHELVESTTDPEGDGITGAEGTCEEGAWCEIGDVCNRTEVLDGVRVQSYWSQSDGACIVSPPAPAAAETAKATTSERPLTKIAANATTAPSGAARSGDGTGSVKPPPTENLFSAAVTGVAPLVPMVAVVTTVVALLLPVSGLAGISGPAAILLTGALAALAVWLLLGFAGRRLATARHGNSDEFGQLSLRVEQLRAHVGELSAVPVNAKVDDAGAVAHAEAGRLLAWLDGELASGGLRWMLGIGYIDAWMALHRAEEALFLIESLEAVIGEGIYDELRLEGSQIANLDELMSKVRRAVGSLSPQAAHLYLGKEDRAAPLESPPPEKADSDLVARTTLRLVRLTLNAYRDELWAGLVRARNKLLKTQLVAGLGTYVLLALLVSNQVNRRVVLAASVFFLFGGLVGFVGRLRDEAAAEKGIEDFGLATARLLTAPLLSGLAAIFGVLLIGLAHLKIGDFALGPSPLPGNSFPMLIDLFDLRTNPAGFMVAALFGLTPALLISYLQSQTTRLNQAIKASEPSGQASG